MLWAACSAPGTFTAPWILTLNPLWSHPQGSIVHSQAVAKTVPSRRALWVVSWPSPLPVVETAPDPGAGESVPSSH